MIQESGPTGSKLGHKTCQILEASKPAHLTDKTANAPVYYLPDDKAGVGMNTWLEAIDARDREMSFGQILYEPNL